MDPSSAVYVWSEDVDRLLCVGVDLRPIGIDNWALNADAAQSAVQALADRGIPVLGGDVYRQKTDGRVESTYDNWYCDRAPTDTDSSFVTRCRDVAVAYIAGMSGAGKQDLLFALVPRV